MSVKLIDRAFDLPGLTAQERVLLLVLANIADDEGRNCFASRAYMLKKAHVANKRSVSRLLSSLEKKGIVETTPRFKNGQQRSNDYQLIGLISEGDIADDQGGVPPVTPPISDKGVSPVTPTLSPRSPRSVT